MKFIKADVIVILSLYFVIIIIGSPPRMHAYLHLTALKNMYNHNIYKHVCMCVCVHNFCHIERIQHEMNIIMSVCQRVYECRRRSETQGEKKNLLYYMYISASLTLCAPYVCICLKQFKWSGSQKAEMCQQQAKQNAIGTQK